MEWLKSLTLWWLHTVSSFEWVNPRRSVYIASLIACRCYDGVIDASPWPSCSVTIQNKMSNNSEVVRDTRNMSMNHTIVKLGSLFQYPLTKSICPLAEKSRWRHFLFGNRTSLSWCLWVSNESVWHGLASIEPILALVSHNAVHFWRIPTIYSELPTTATMRYVDRNSPTCPTVRVGHIVLKPPDIKSTLTLLLHGDTQCYSMQIATSIPDQYPS